MTAPTQKAPAPPELRARLLSAAVMLAAVASAVYLDKTFPVIVVGCAYASLREWHRLVDGGHLAIREMLLSTLAVAVAMVLTYLHADLMWPSLALAGGAVASAVSAKLRRSSAFWHGLGPIYIGLTAVGLVALRADVLRGVWIVVGIFVAIWASDSAALFCGRTIGGPKLAPLLSPNKTWAGFLGGIVAAGMAEGLYVAILPFLTSSPLGSGGQVWQATMFGFFLALLGHCGDLFESWVKRRFKAKNSGTLIPGHGGMLDRVDSLLFAVPVAAALILLAGFDPLFGYGL